MAQTPVQAHLYSGRPAIWYPNATKSQGGELFEAIVNSGATYLMLKPPFWTSNLDETGRRVEAIIQEHNDMFAMVFSDPTATVRVYEIRGLGNLGGKDDTNSPRPDARDGRL